MKILILANFNVGLYLFRRELIAELLKNHQVLIALPDGEYIKPLEEMGCRFIHTPMERRGMNPVRDFSLIRCFAEESGYRCQIDIDVFDVNGEYYISEVNPRFGGGYPHAYECGVDHMALIVNNLDGMGNPVSIGNYEDGLVMMKFNEIQITKAQYCAKRG